MIFRISGANAKTGADCSIVVTADTESEALSRAREKGLFPTKVARDFSAERHAEEQHKKNRQAEKGRLIAEQRKAHIESTVARVKQELAGRLENCLPVFLYETVYLPVNSELLGKKLNNGFNIPLLRQYGMRGWEVMQVVPKTVGVELENISLGSTTGHTYGGGSGGNIVGVHVILKKNLSIEDLKPDRISEIEEHIRSNLSSFG